MSEQRAFLLWRESEHKSNLAELNQLLDQGWRVTQMAPMSGIGDTSQYAQNATVVVLEK